MQKNRTGIEELLAQSGWLARLANAMVRDAAERDDLVQEVWLAALRNPPRAGEERSWFRSVLRRRIADRRRRSPETEPEVTVSSDEAEPPKALSTLESHERLGRALRGLPDVYREVVVARYFHGESPQEIAVRLRRPAGTIRSQLSRGLELLRGTLEEETPGDSSRWALALVPLALRATPLPETAATSLFSSLTFKSIGVAMSQKTAVVATGVLIVTAVAWVVIGSRETGDDDLGSPGDRIASRSEATRSRASTGAEDRTGTTSSEASPDAKPSDLAALEIILRDPESRLVPKARVLVYNAEEVLIDARTDESGVITKRARPGKEYCAVLADGRPPFIRRISLSGAQTLTLPDGAIFSGRARVAGGLPHRPLRIAMKQRTPELDALPEHVRRRLWPQPRETGHGSLLADADGGFRFEGLRSDQPLSILISEGFAFADDRILWRRTASFDRPRTDVTLELIAMPRVIGQIVSAETGEGVSGRALSLSYDVPGRGGSSIGATTDVDGRFVIGISNLEFRNLKLSIPHGGAYIERSGKSSFRDTLDLGSIPLDSLRPWHIEVVNQKGQPVENAMVVVGEGLSSSPSDAQGRCSFDALSWQFDQAFVGAPGYRTRKTLITRDDEKPQRITLLPANLLEVSVTGLPEGIKPRYLTISGPRALMPPAFRHDLATHSHQAGNVASSEDADGFSLRISADPQGRFLAQDLVPGVSFSLSVEDAQGQLIGDVQGLQMGTVDKKVVELPFEAAKIRLVALEVVDAQGRPVPDVEVTDLGANEDDVTLHADEKGRLLLLRPRDSDPGIRVSARGFGTIQRAGSALNSESLRVVLTEDR